MTRPVGRPPVYPWDGMEIGQSFCVAKPYQIVLNASRAQTRKTGNRYEVEEVPGGIVVTRVASQSTSTIKIEYGITLPPQGARGRQAIYPWDVMGINDSFMSQASADAMRHTARYQTEKTGRKYSVATVDGGTRVWRVA